MAHTVLIAEAMDERVDQEAIVKLLLGSNVFLIHLRLMGQSRVRGQQMGGHYILPSGRFCKSHDNGWVARSFYREGKSQGLRTII